MTKKEYIEQLTRALTPFSASTQAEVLEDYEAHFAAGLDSGRSEDEICSELGSIEVFIEELSQMEPASKPACVPAASQQIDNSHQESSKPREHYVSNASRLELNGLHADVSLAPSSDDQFHIYYECHGTERQKAQYQFYFREEGDIIYAGIRKIKTISGLFASLAAPSISLNVYIPPSMTEITAETVSGDIDADRFRVPALHLSSTSGDISCDRTDTQLLEVRSTSGDIDEDHLYTAKLLTSTVSGDITVDAARFDSCELSTVSGDIEMNIRSDSTVSINTVSGDVDLYLYAGIQGSIGTVSGDIEMNLESTHAGFSIDCSTVSGDIEIGHNASSQHYRRGAHAEIEGEGCYELALSTTSGDITVF